MAQTRVALVTGGGKGLGEAIAIALRAEGHKLVLLGRDETALNRVPKETGALPLVCDVTDSAALDKVMGRAENEAGPIDILVHNAGIALSAPLARTSDEDLDRIFAVNLRAALEFATRGVTANAVCPAFCDTDMATHAIDAMVDKAKRTPDEARASLEGTNPQKRIIPPAHVGHIVAMLTSEAASSVNGQAIPIDGGMVMK